MSDMAKRRHLTKSEQTTPKGAELILLCERITVSGRLTEPGIRELIRWLRLNRGVGIPAVEVLTEIVSRIVSDRSVSNTELAELHESIEAILPPTIRKIAVKRRKERERAEYEKELERAGVVLIADRDGKKHDLHRLVDRVEYGEKTIASIAAALGPDVASVVEQHVRARERTLNGYVVKETAGGAWIFRLVQGGDCCIPISGCRIISGSLPGPISIGIPPSLAASVDRQLAHGITVTY
jgi:hypothetical protein